LKEQKKQASLTLEVTRLAAQNYVVKAPYDSVITALSVKVGDLASTGTSVAVVADTTAWNVAAYVDEIDVLNVKAGQDALVTMDAYAAETLAGKVTYVGRALTTTSSSVSAYPVTIQVTKPPQTIVDGMSADASIAIAVAKGVLAVPVEAVLTENGKSYVTSVSFGTDKTMTTSKVEVKTGIEGDEYVEITSGLKAGDRVLRKASTTATTPSSTTTTTTNDQRGGMGIPGGIVPGGAGRPGGN
jgi:RND family efflux transporter MFP subunit